MSQARPFSFDTVFDEDGVVIASAPVVRTRRAYSAEEVEGIRQAAFRDGETSAQARAADAQARALSELAEAAREGLAALARVAADHRAASAELALACAGRIADAALARFPTAALEAALEALAMEIETAPRLLVRAADPNDDLKAAVEAAAFAAGFQGQILFKAEPGASRAAFTLEWGDGKATFDPAAAVGRIAETLQAALAAEGPSGEVLKPGA
jgi:flagellar assembly protein FliH